MLALEADADRQDAEQHSRAWMLANLLQPYTKDSLAVSDFYRSPTSLSKDEKDTELRRRIEAGEMSYTHAPPLADG